MLEEEGDSTVIAVSPCAPAWPAWWCDSCRSVPCSVYSRSDTAYLCGGCDTSIHSANSLARRHHRVPVQPIHVGVPTIGGTPAPPRDLTRLMVEDDGDDHFIGVEVDEYLDLVEFSSCEEGWKADEKEKGCHNDMSKEVDGVVPLNCLVGEEEDRLARSFQKGYDGFEGGIDYSSLASSHGHNVSPSSIESTPAAESSMIAISSSHIMTYKETIELFSGPQLQMPQVFSPRDREARVLRYREKKKTRKFQKVIRYASRKAYAETRPRIKGRFAKRTDFDHQVDQIFVAPVMIEASYGVVPSY